jgi:arsenate reductase
MAECLLNRLGRGRFRAFSAGSHPTGVVHPLALDLLRSHDYEVEGLRSKDWNEFAAADAPRIDFVITVCDNAAGEVCPVWPVKPITAHWGFVDPAAATGSEVERRNVFADIYRELRHRVEAFVSLPIEQLDRLGLQDEVRGIGKLQVVQG